MILKRPRRNRKSQAEALDAVSSYLMKRQDARKPVIEEEEENVNLFIVELLYGNQKFIITEYNNKGIKK